MRLEVVIRPLDLASQGQFISLINAMEMQLESSAPATEVVRLLGDALLALTKARRLRQPIQANLHQRILALNQRIHAITGGVR